MLSDRSACEAAAADRGSAGVSLRGSGWVKQSTGTDCVAHQQRGAVGAEVPRRAGDGQVAVSTGEQDNGPGSQVQAGLESGRGRVVSAIDGAAGARLSGGRDMRMEGETPDSGAMRAGTTRPTLSPLRLLTYVHLRNIHRSTGAGRVARQLTEHLAQRSDIALQVLADEGDRARILPLVGEPWQGFRYHTFEAGTSRRQAMWYLTGRPRAEDFWSEAQVVFCTGESYVPTRSAPLAVTAHDAAFFEPSAHRRDRAFWTQRMKWRLLFGRLSARADMIHTVSQFSADRLGHFFPSLRDRLRVVPNAVTPHFFLPVTAAGRAYLEVEGLAGRRYVLVPGGLHFRKNADLILEAIPRLLAGDPDLVVAIVNHSDPVYAHRARALGERVRLLGFVEDSALHALYASAAAVWFPSRYEGFGLPVLEAMAAGAPVVASDASSLPEIAGDAAILAHPASAGAHLEALLGVLGNAALAQEMRAKGHLRAARFTWANSAAELAAYLRELL